MTDDEKLLTAIKAETDQNLDGWALRAAKMPPEQPERRSQLAHDDKVFPSFPVSETTRLSLVAAGDHLRLARTAINAGQLFPIAHFTVLRGALVASAQAVWILSSEDRHARQERALAVIAETYDQLKVYSDEASFGTAVGKAEAAKHREWLSGRIARVSALRTNHRRLKLTEVIGDALDSTFTEERHRQDGRALWRLMSGDAHGLSWSVMQRATFDSSPIESSALKVAAARGSLYEIAQPFLCSYRLLKHGWSLFDRRCEEGSNDRDTRR